MHGYAQAHSNLYIYTSVDLCISMHRALWIRSCVDLSVVLSVSGLSLVFCHVLRHVFCLVLGLVLCLPMTGHVEYAGRSGRLTVWEADLSGGLPVWETHLSGMLTCLGRSPVWEADLSAKLTCPGS